MFYLGKFILLFLLISFSNICLSANYDSWKLQFSKSLAKHGIKKHTRNIFLKHATYNQKVIDIYFKQRKPYPILLNDFLKMWLYRPNENESWVIKEGRALLKKHHSLLDKVEKRFKVDKEIIVALWGIETKYGNMTGNYPVLDSLSSLAYKSKRKRFYRKELISALKIIQRNKIAPNKFLGSWAGAIGHCQFMPTNYFVYGVDYDKDGKKDLFNSMPDIFASIANYLKRNRWRYKKPIGHWIKLPPRFKRKYIGKTYRLNSSWNNLGVRKFTGEKLPKSTISSKIVKLTMKDINHLAVHYNFKVILRWNRSHLFGLKSIILKHKLETKGKNVL